MREPLQSWEILHTRTGAERKKGRSPYTLLRSPPENVAVGVVLFLKNETSGEYVTPSSWERRDLISNQRIEQWNAERWGAQTGEEAIEQAKEDLQEFFNRPLST